MKEQLSEYNNYLLQRFNNYEVPLSMSAEDVRDYLIQFNKEYMKQCQACGEEITHENGTKYHHRVRKVTGKEKIPQDIIDRWYKRKDSKDNL